MRTVFLIVHFVPCLARALQTPLTLCPETNWVITTLIFAGAGSVSVELRALPLALNEVEARPAPEMCGLRYRTFEGRDNRSRRPETAVAEPPPLVAITATTTVCPTSLPVSV